MSRARAALAALAAVSSLLMSGCAQPPATPGTTTAALEQSTDRLRGVEVTGEPGRPPQLTVTDQEAATAEGDRLQRQVLHEGGGDELTADDTVVIVLASFHSSDGAPISPYGSLGPATSLRNDQLPKFVAPSFIGLHDGDRVLISAPIQFVADERAVGNHILIVADVVKVKPGASATGTPTGATFDWATVSAGEGKPQVSINSAAPEPTEQHTAVILQGDGEEVQKDDTVVVQYSGYLLADGTEFDTSWTTGMPPAFPTSMVVPGFANALVGQRVGSRVVTVFPSELGYGDDDYPPIPGGSSLVFVADIIRVVG